MKPFRYRALALVAVVGLAPWAHAQTTRPAGPELPGLARLEQRVGSLDLTDDQKKQVQSLKDEIAEKIRAIAPELKDASPEDRRQKIRDAVGDVREQFMSILTPEQKAKLKGGVEEKRVPGRKPLKDLKPGKSEKEPPAVAKLRENVDGLGLSPEQKTKTDAILADAADQAKQIREDGGNRPREKMQELAKSVREKLGSVLTPEQKQKLADEMPGRPGRRDAAKTPATRPADATHPDAPVTKVAGASSRPAPAAPALVAGQPAPAFTLVRLNGSAVTNKDLVSKPTVLVFGSLSSPSFRDRVPKLQALKNRYRSRANVVIVYAREAHPTDGPWKVERNKEDKIDAPAPKTLAERTALATKLRDLTKTDIDILVDDLSDSTLAAFGDKPDGAIVLGPYGTVVGTQTYADPSGLPRLIDEAMKTQK